MLTVAEISKSVSGLRQDVMRWKREAKEPQTLELIGLFMATYKAIKGIQDNPVKEYPIGIYKTKAQHLQTGFQELLGWHEGVYQHILSERSVTEIKDENQAELFHETELVTEIKSESQLESSSEKALEEVTEIKEEVKKRGGSRDGSGRKKSEFEARKISLALRPEHWEHIDSVLKSRQRYEPKLTQSDLLRQIFEFELRRQNE